MWCRYAIANLDVIVCKYLCDIGIHVITQMTKNYVKQVESWNLPCYGKVIFSRKICCMQLFLLDKKGTYPFHLPKQTTSRKQQQQADKVHLSETQVEHKECA
jgi:hypothetical protein